MNGDPLLFLVFVVAITVTPGADMALVIRAATLGGMRAAAQVIAGITLGLGVHITCSIVGVSAVIAASDTALDLLRIVGALWLGWIAANALRDGIAPRAAHEDAERLPTKRTGFVTNVLNVKILLFYLAFLPQFAKPGDDFVQVAATLAAVQVVIGVTWLFFCAAIATRMRRLLAAGRRPRRLLDLLTGTVLLLASLELLWSAIRDRW
jgi:threonine/homoserine/homoserine lactone efflux protein